MNRLGLGLGLAFGFLISAAHFNDADFIHRMLLLQTLYPFEVYAAAIGTAMPLLWILSRAKWVTPLGGPMHLVRVTVRHRQVYGGVLFGAGWALSCTCPVPAIGMLSSGSFLALFVVLGLFMGIEIGEWRAQERKPPAPAPAAGAV